MKTNMIELIPVGQAVGPLKWEMSLNRGAPQGQKDYPVVTVNPGDTSDLQFTIRHPGSIKFANGDPFCAQLGTAKPAQCDTKVFSAQVDSKTGVLTVHDNNSVAGTYTYVVNFDGGPPQLDPIIKNGGCCTGTNHTAYSLTTIAEYGALFLLLVAAVIAARQIFLRRDNDTIKPS